jgi:hypothetical protein
MLVSNNFWVCPRGIAFSVFVIRHSDFLLRSLAAPSFRLQPFLANRRNIFKN